MVPIIELRGALPIGEGIAASALGVAISDLPLAQNLLIIFAAILGNLLPIPFILILLQKVLNWLRDKKYTKKFVAWLEKKVEKNRSKIDKYGYVGLYILVAIPLPGTGAWTGALVASCLEMQKKKSLIAIIFGVLTAAVIVLIATYGVSKLF